MGLEQLLRSDYEHFRSALVTLPSIQRNVVDIIRVMPVNLLLTHYRNGEEFPRKFVVYNIAFETGEPVYLLVSYKWRWGQYEDVNAAMSTAYILLDGEDRGLRVFFYDNDGYLVQNRTYDVPLPTKRELAAFLQENH